MVKLNQFACTVICILFMAPSLFAQNRSLTFLKRVIKSGHWCPASDLSSLHNGDTLVLYKKDRRGCARSMKLRTNTILLKEFGSTYSGEPFVEFKTKGKWHLTNDIIQLLILDFPKSRIELQLIDSKDDSMKFVVKTREQKDA